MALIITGHQRSGTTLLARLCNTHPQVCVVREFGNFLSLGQPTWRYSLRLFKRWGGLLLRKWPLEITVTRPGKHSAVIRANSLFVLRYLAEILRAGGPVVTAQIVDSALRELHPGARIVGDKYPEYIFDLDELAANEDLSTLVIYRDCRDVTSSTLRSARTRWRSMPFFVRKVDTAEKVAHRWVRAIELMESNSDRILALRYEDLVLESESALGDLAEWLGIDPKGFDSASISSRSIGKHRDGLTSQELEAVREIAGPTMERLGYR